MSAEDLVKLAAHIIHDYPQYYSYFAMKDFTWSNIKQPNRNILVGENIGVDGLKTGHTEIGGYGMVASSLRNGRRLILVLNGFPTEHERHRRNPRRLLDIGYREFKDYQLMTPDLADIDVWGGAKTKVGLTVALPVKVLMQVDSRRDMKVTLHYDGPVTAPIAAGQQLGTVTVAVPGKPDTVVPAVAAEAVPSSGIFDHMMMGLQVLVFGVNKI